MLPADVRLGPVWHVTDAGLHQVYLIDRGERYAEVCGPGRARRWCDRPFPADKADLFATRSEAEAALRQRQQARRSPTPQSKPSRD